MSNPSGSLPEPTPEQRRTAAEQYQRAQQWLAVGRPDMAVRLLVICCLHDPANLIYRNALREARRWHQPRLGLFGLVKKWLTTRRLQREQRAKDWPKVLQTSEDLLALDATNVSAHLALATAFESLGLVDHAVSCLEQAGAAENRIAPLTGELARLYERTGKFSLARKLTDPPAKLSAKVEVQHWLLREQIKGGDPDLYLRMVQWFRRVGDQRAARAWIDRGLKATAGDFALGMERAQLDLDSLRQDAAIALERLAGQPGNMELQSILGRLRHEIEAREIDLFRQQVDRHPADRNGSLQLGILLLKAGQFEGALEAFQMARSDASLAGRAILYSAYCHLNSRQWRQAEPLFEEALALLPAESDATRKEVLFLLAQHAAEQGKWDKALARGDELARLDAGYRDIGAVLLQWRKRTR